MTSPTAPSCPLGVSAATLSAWRDGLLDERVADQLATHAPACAACRAQLSAFERLGATVRSGADPDLREPVWSGLRARILRGEKPGPNLRMKALWGGGIATVAAALLVALFLTLLSGHSGLKPGSGAPTRAVTAPSVTATATARPTSTTPASAAGWRAVYSTTAFAGPVLAFAPSDASVAYLCAASYAGSTSMLSSSDGSATFHPAGQLPPSGQCGVSVDPTNARDLTASLQTSSSSTLLYRSQDGGATWQRQDLGGLSVMCLGWQDGALWATAAAEDSGGPGLTELWVSRNGGPMAEVDQNGALANGVNLTNMGQAALITGHDATVYIVFGQVSVQPIGETVIRSTDGGATWAQVKFMDGAQLVDVVNTTPDQKTLVGDYDSQISQMVVSRDGGVSWQKLAAEPAGVSAMVPVWVTPDGSLLAVSGQYQMAQNPDDQLYELAAGASSWTVALTLPQSIYMKAISWDARGKPVAVWAMGTLNASTGLFAHSLGS